MKTKLRWLMVLALFFALPVLAQQTKQPEQPPPQSAPDNPLTALGSEYQNSIKLLQNRFRIDYKVDEVTMVFFRRHGSAPVVLVQPDGAKIFQTQADGEQVFWYDAANYDMISIKNPVPGPWQAVGEIMPGSRAMVISDIQLHAEQLPSVIFSGEILKQTAYLTNGDQPIDYREFRDVVTLDIKFISTNNPNYNNFGADTQIIATFEDNGRGMDEAPLDGTFTGQFNLRVPAGEWQPLFTVTTPMFTREQIDPNLMLYPNPVLISHEEDTGGGGYHKLNIDVQREHVDINTLLIDGKIRFPNGDVQNFSLTEQSDQARQYLIVNYEYGVYRVKLTAYGNTTSGRDFILDIPEYTFITTEPEPEPVEAVPTEESATTQEGESTVQPTPQQPTDSPAVEDEPDMSTGAFLGWIIGLNLGLLLIGGVLIWWFLLRTPKDKTQPVAVEDALVTDEKPGLMAKIKGLFTKSKKTSAQG